MVSITIPQGMEYTTTTAGRSDSIVYVTSDKHLWRKHGQKQGDKLYMKCYFGRLNGYMKKEKIEECPGNIKVNR